MKKKKKNESDHCRTRRPTVDEAVTAWLEGQDQPDPDFTRNRILALMRKGDLYAE